MGGLYDAATLRAHTMQCRRLLHKSLGGAGLAQLFADHKDGKSKVYGFAVAFYLMTREESNEHMRTLGVEPGSKAWEACMMPLHYVRCWNHSGVVTTQELLLLVHM